MFHHPQKNQLNMKVTIFLSVSKIMNPSEICHNRRAKPSSERSGYLSQMHKQLTYTFFIQFKKLTRIN